MARFIAGAIGIEPNVWPYYDDDRSHELSMLKLTDPIEQGVGIYSTIGLSDHENNVEVTGGVQNIPVELMMAVEKRFDKAANILATSAFFVMKDKYEARPGSVFKHMVTYYYKNIDMKHIYLVEPWLWEEKLDQLTLDTKKVAFLMLVPISDAEVDYKLQHGDKALQELLFEEHQIDFYDLKRKSVL